MTEECSFSSKTPVSERVRWRRLSIDPELLRFESALGQRDKERILNRQVRIYGEPPFIQSMGIPAPSTPADGDRWDPKCDRRICVGRAAPDGGASPQRLDARDSPLDQRGRTRVQNASGAIPNPIHIYGERLTTAP